MIKEFQIYHGLVFARILHSLQGKFTVEAYPTPDNASYVINGDIGVYVKFSTKRMSPWRFSLHKKHQDEIEAIKNSVGKVFLLLVCRNDGIVALDYQEIRQILDDVYQPIEWISVSRPPRGMYSVKGSDGKMKLKIGINGFPNKLFAPKYNK